MVQEEILTLTSTTVETIEDTHNWELANSKEEPFSEKRKTSANTMT